MLSFLMDVLSNMVANIAFWGLLGIVFWGFGRASHARFVQFLALHESPIVTVMLSNLWQPEASQRKIGFTISRHEQLAAQAISSFLGRAPGRLPDVVRGLVDQLWLRSRPRCMVDVSPPTLDTVDQTTCMIVIGGAARNSHRRHLIRHGVPAARLEDEEEIGSEVRSDEVRRVIISRGQGGKQVVQYEQGIAVVEKVVVPGRPGLFFCLGPRADGTWIAVEYLVRNWRSLEREFRGDPFVVCLGFPRGNQFLEQYVEPSVLARVRP